MKSKEFIGTEATISSLLDNFFGVFLGWLLHMFLSRHLGPSGYGQFSIILVIFQIFVSCFNPGITYAMARYTPLSSTPKSVLNAGIRIELIVDIVIYCLYFSFLNFICHLFSILELRLHLILLGLMIMPHGIASIIIGYLRGRLEFIETFKINLVYNVIKLICCIFFVMLGLDLLGVIIGLICAEAAFALSACLITGPLRLRPVSFLKEIIFFSLPFCFLNLSSFIMQRTDIMCIKILLPGYNYVGYYAAALRLGEILLFLFSATQVHLLPVLSSALHRKDYVYACQSLQIAIRYCLLLALPLSIWVAIHCKIIMSFVFSYKYVQGSGVLFIFSIGMMIFSILSAFTTVILASGRIWFLFWSVLLFFVINLILNLALIPKMGINGAAISTAVSLVLFALLMFVYVQKQNLLFFQKKAWLSKSTIYNALIATLIIGALGGLLKVSTWYMFGLKTLLASVLYATFLFLLKEINSDDKNIMRFLFGAIFFRKKD